MCSPSSSYLVVTREASHDGPSNLRRQAHSYTTRRDVTVYNIGGGFDNTVSILEAFAKIEALSGKAMDFEYVDDARIGDHIVYYSNLDKMKADYPDWDITVGLDEVFEDLYASAIA